jgi:hypothetical protein
VNESCRIDVTVLSYRSSASIMAFNSSVSMTDLSVCFCGAVQESV